MMMLYLPLNEDSKSKLNTLKWTVEINFTFQRSDFNLIKFPALQKRGTNILTLGFLLKQLQRKMI